MRREFSKEFKRGVVSLVVEQGYSPIAAVKSLGIHTALLSRWFREHAEHAEDGGDAFRWKEKLRPEQEEIRQLREEQDLRKTPRSRQNLFLMREFRQLNDRIKNKF